MYLIVYKMGKNYCEFFNLGKNSTKRQQKYNIYLYINQNVHVFYFCPKTIIKVNKKVHVLPKKRYFDPHFSL